MSDTWYHDPLDLPPYEDGFGQLWTVDGKCLNPSEPATGLDWLDEWPEELQFEVFRASVSIDLNEALGKWPLGAGSESVMLPPVC